MVWKMVLLFLGISWVRVGDLLSILSLHLRIYLSFFQLSRERVISSCHDVAIAMLSSIRIEVGFVLSASRWARTAGSGSPKTIVKMSNPCLLSRVIIWTRYRYQTRLSSYVYVEVQCSVRLFHIIYYSLIQILPLYKVKVNVRSCVRSGPFYV